MVVVAAGCSRGQSGPVPTEDLRPSVIGVIEHPAASLPVALRGGATFAPPSGAVVTRLHNWPSSTADEADGLYEPVGLEEGVLLFGGRRADASWWYQLAYPGFGGDCAYVIHGGSFDDGDGVHFSSGVRLPKAPGFNVRGQGSGPIQTFTDDMGFPGHMDDSICLDEQGRATWFDRFIGM